MAAHYRFLDRWLVPAAPEEVYDVIGDQLAYPVWWGESFLDVQGDEGPPRPGRRATILSRGYLPYKLRWQAVITACERPRRIEIELAGDFLGGGPGRSRLRTAARVPSSTGARASRNPSSST